MCGWRELFLSAHQEPGYEAMTPAISLVSIHSIQICSVNPLSKIQYYDISALVEIKKRTFMYWYVQLCTYDWHWMPFNNYTVNDCNILVTLWRMVAQSIYVGQNKMYVACMWVAKLMWVPKPQPRYLWRRFMCLTAQFCSHYVNQSVR